MLKYIIMEKIDENKNRKISISVTNANVLAIFVLLVVALILAVPFALIWHDSLGNSLDTFVYNNGDVIDNYLDKITSDLSFASLILIFVIPLLILGIVGSIGIGLYVLIGGVALACYAENGWKSVEFGFKKLLTPYGRCKEPLNVRHFMMANTIPVIILGILPAIASLCIGSVVLLVWAIVFISSGWADIYIALKLAKEDKNAKVIDIQSEDEMGVYILED